MVKEGSPSRKGHVMGIYYYYGVMGSNKTLKLLTMAYNYAKVGRKAVIIRPAIDTRTAYVESRIGVKQKADVTVSNELSSKEDEKLAADIVEKARQNNSVVLVDEAQFFKPSFIYMLEKYSNASKVSVYGFGLLKDFRNHLFNGTIAWLEIADSIHEVKTVCEKCNNKATCNALETKHHFMVASTFDTDSKRNTVIGDTQFHVYCRACWDKLYNSSNALYASGKQ